MSCGGTPEFAVSLDDDLIGAAKIVEVVHVLRAEIHLQRRKYVGRREAHFLRLSTGLYRRRPKASPR